ncbi:MAG: ABC transporter permease [Dehalococcoidia bacterium]|nr:MAG: ABC transporter permease [Dehalococcoidia bacterium]
MKADTIILNGSPTVIERKGEGLWTKAGKRFLRHKLAMLGLIILLILIILAVFAPQLSQYDPYALNLRARSAPPSWEHPFGTDGTGRDIWARILYGGRVSLSVGLVAVSIAAVIGIVIGSLAGFYSGKTDMVLMRFTDMIMTFPRLVIIITMAAVLGPSIYNTMLIIGILSWTAIARLVRGEFLSLRKKEFVEAAYCIGTPSRTIIFRHILPNTVSSITVAITLGVASAILTEASLSFLGLGVQAPIPSWGNMLHDAQTLSILEGQPWMWLPPGVMIALAVLSINFVGDGLRDALDPRSLL